MEKQDIQRLCILVETLLIDLKSIKRRQYYREYYRKNREKINAKAKQKRKCVKHRSTDGIVYFD